MPRRTKGDEPDPAPDLKGLPPRARKAILAARLRKAGGPEAVAKPAVEARAEERSAPARRPRGEGAGEAPSRGPARRGPGGAGRDRADAGMRAERGGRDPSMRGPGAGRRPGPLAHPDEAEPFVDEGVEDAGPGGGEVLPPLRERPWRQAQRDADAREDRRRRVLGPRQRPGELTPRVVRIAGEVLDRASREEPADRVLADRLKAHRETLWPEQMRLIAQLVHGFYRWFLWTKGRPLPARLARTRELGMSHATSPTAMPIQELREKAAPAWAAELVPDVGETWWRALQVPPVPWLRARPGRAQELATALGDCQGAPHGLCADALKYVGERDLFRTPQFRSGEFEVQDLGSQLVAPVAAAAAGETWWDACAGTGGKTLHLADLMRNRGLVWASDKAAWRLEKLRRRAARARLFNFRTVLWNGGAARPTRTAFDGVVVDAPCSGLGTWHRDPQARWTSRPEDVTELAELQLTLLRHAAPAVKPGGRLVYAVCTVTRAETSDVARAFSASAEGQDFAPRAIEGVNLDAIARAGSGVVAADRSSFLLPQGPLGTNGMYIALWERRRAGSG